MMRSVRSLYAIAVRLRAIKVNNVVLALESSLPLDQISGRLLSDPRYMGLTTMGTLLTFSLNSDCNWKRGVQ